jgi:hypothetical protein
MMVRHNQPTELIAKYKTSCPRPSCDIPILKGNKIRVWRDKWYHGNCSLKLEKDWIKREKKRDRRLSEEKAKRLNSSSTKSLFGGDTGTDADYKYEHDQINEVDTGPKIATQENLRRALKKEADNKMLEKIRRPSSVPGGTDDEEPKKYGTSAVETLVNEVMIYREKNSKLSTALRWYSQRSNYECNVEDDRPAIMYDEGRMARNTIKSLTKIK